MSSDTPMSWLADQLLSLLQRRCQHPSELVASDVLEGSVNGLRVKWCRRCGAIKTDWTPGNSPFATLEHFWRRPDPNLWRGR